MSIDWPFNDTVAPEFFDAPGFPLAIHPAEADLFTRQASMPRHRQTRLEASHVMIVGCGGLGSWAALALVRMGIRRLTLIDFDHFDRTNAPRQLAMPDELGQPKAHALARALARHATNPCRIQAIAEPFERAMTHVQSPADALAVGVDNNGARLAASDYALRHHIPVVFSMLSMDGLRAQAFAQRPNGPCLSCVLPDLDRHRSTPCASAAITSCYMASAHAVAMLADALMSEHPTLPIWRETSLDGTTERTGNPPCRFGCACRLDVPSSSLTQR